MTTSKNNRLSHSAMNKFMQCGKMYEFHYIDRLREKTRSGALVFGNALDTPLDNYHLGKYKSLKDPREKMYEDFDKEFEYSTVSGREKEHIPTNENIVYSASDFDKDLLLEEDMEELIEFSKELAFDGHPNSLVKFIKEEKSERGWMNLSSRQRQFYNYANWLCLRRKSRLMIDAYLEKIVPHIKEVLAIQKKTTIKNEEGDEVVGYIDLIVKWEENGETYTVLFDRKTSSIEYKIDSVIYSPQLTLYVGMEEEVYNSRIAGFIVFYKQIQKNKKKVCKSCKFEAEKGSRHKKCYNEIDNKRCNGEWNESIDPKCRVDVIIDEIPERAEEIVMNNFDEANEMIKERKFTRNLNACNNYYGGTCPYRNFCWNNDDNDLIKLSKK